MSVEEAVEVSGLGERRLRQILAAGDRESRLPGAFKDERGRWRIPERSVANLRARQPLTQAEKGRIRTLEGLGWPAKRIAHEINAARKARGVKPLVLKTIYNQMNADNGDTDALVRGDLTEKEREKLAWLKARFSEEMRKPEFVAALMEGRPSPGDVLDLGWLPGEIREYVREQLNRGLSQVAGNLPLGDVSEQDKEGLKMGLGLGFDLGADYVMKRQAQKEEEAVLTSVMAAVKAVDDLLKDEATGR